MKFEMDSDDGVVMLIICLTLILAIAAIQGCRIERDYSFKMHQSTNTTERLK